VKFDEMAGAVTQYTPKKLQKDAIIEAVCQLSFNSPELPEIIIGRLSDIKSASDFNINRLPTANLPYDIRSSDANFRYQPTMELVHKNKTYLIRFSERVISFHVTGADNYIGWNAFRAELLKTFENLFEKITVSDVFNISFRYINAIITDKHYISDIHQLNFETIVKGVKLDCPINLNFIVQNDENHLTTTRIAHRNFVQGVLPEATNAIVDVEVNTPASSFSVKSLDDVMSWIDVAHDFEKEAFFKLIPDEIIQKLEVN
jgi:uncharacterized protein (TIGR04255 family)